MPNSKKKNETGQAFETVFEISEERLEEIRREAEEKARKTRHEWKQKGPWLVCQSCEMPHSVWIGPEKILVGFKKNGEPILKDRSRMMNNRQSRPVGEVGKKKPNRSKSGVRSTPPKEGLLKGLRKET